MAAETHSNIDKFLGAREMMEWAWGTHDCLTFAGALIKVMTGEDYVSQFGPYKSRLGAYKILAEYGDVSDLLTHLFGQSHARNWTQYGDVVTMPGPYGESAGVSLGHVAVFAEFPRGVAVVDLFHVERAWSVPWRQ